jgi:hypothetical protein
LFMDAIVKGGSIDGLDIRGRLDRPLVGIGAPVAQFVPAAAARLGTQAHVPNHADVAGAIGAIASDVVIRRRISIELNPEGRYDLTTDTGVRSFDDLDQAERFARRFLTDQIGRQAWASGTRQREVTLRRDERWAPLADGSDQFVSLVVEGVLVGRPVDNAR